MAIQFFCRACGQPIEVDDEMAGQTVTCPYCYNVVTTPVASVTGSGDGPPTGSADKAAPTDSDGGVVPTSSDGETAPTGPTGEGVGDVPAATVGEQVEAMPYAGYADKPPKGGVLGWVALGLIVLSGLCMAYSTVTARSMMQGLNVQQAKTPEEVAEIQKIMQQRMASKPSLMIISPAGSCVLPLAAVICAVIALIKRSRPRWPAITTIVLVGVLVIVVCIGIVYQISTTSSGAGV